MSALLHAALWSGAATLVVLVASRCWRREDADLWHGVWVALACASLVLPIANLVLPHLQVLFVGDDAIARQVEAWTASNRLAGVMAVIVAVGAAIFALRLIGGLLLVERLRRRSVPVEGLPLVRLRQVIGDAAASVRTHGRVQVPLTAGWRDPIVVLPETWITWETERLAAVLRHELAHVARRDYAWNVVAACFQTVFWFSPAAWIVMRRIRLTAELAADRSASDVLGRVSYARILVESARELLRGRSAGMLAPGAATVLEARVAALTRMPDELPSSSVQARRIAAAILVAALLASGFIRVGFGTAAAIPAGDHDQVHPIRHALH